MISFEMRAATQVFPFLPHKHRVIRFEIPFLTLDVVPETERNVSYRWHCFVPEERVRLSDLVQAARALSALLDSSAAPPQLLVSETESVELPHALPSEDPGARTQTLLEAATNAGAIARIFVLDMEDVLVLPRQLVDNHAQLKLFAGVFGGSSAALRFLIEEGDKDLDGRPIAHVVVPGVPLGSWVLLMAVAVFWSGNVAGWDWYLSSDACNSCARA